MAKALGDVGKPSAVRQALARLTKAGKLKRIRRGLYERPRAHPLIGESSSSSMDVVRVILEARNAPWHVSGAYAANLLGLSEQVPSQLVIKTTASVPSVNLGKTQITFQRVAPSGLIGAGTTAGTVIQAIRYLGPKGLEPAHTKRLKKNLKPSTKRDLQKLAPKLPQWMRPVVQEISMASP
jgi:predicted transcriptional regulator of viral defense system